MATPITTLELRKIEIPRSPVLEMIEKELGRSITHEHRHFLAGEPVHCGNLLEMYENGAWVLGRYEWSTVLTDLPSLHIGERIMPITEDCLLRWPK